MKVFKPSKATVIKMKIRSLSNYVCGLFKHRTGKKVAGYAPVKAEQVTNSSINNVDKSILSLENDIKSIRAEVNSIKQQMNKRPMRLISSDYTYSCCGHRNNVECTDCDICLQAKLYDTNVSDRVIEGFNGCAEKKVKIT